MDKKGLSKLTKVATGLMLLALVAFFMVSTQTFAEKGKLKVMNTSEDQAISAKVFNYLKGLFAPTTMKRDLVAKRPHNMVLKALSEKNLEGVKRTKNIINESSFGITSKTANHGGAAYSWTKSYLASDLTLTKATEVDISSPKYPCTPIEPDPVDDEEDVTYKNLTLYWSCAVTEPVVYSVYLDTNETPETLLAEDLHEPFYGPIELEPDTDYYWQVVSTTESLDEAESEIWHFKTMARQDPPFINLAGYYMTHVTQAEGGTLNLIAWVTDENNDVDYVELMYQGAPLDPRMYLVDDGAHGDFDPGDNIYGMEIPVGPGIPSGLEVLLMLQAYDQFGHITALWPFLEVWEPATSKAGCERYASYMNAEIAIKHEFDFKRLMDEAISGKAATDAPKILLAGYMTTTLYTDIGGNITLLAAVIDPQGDTSSVELYFDHMPTGIALLDNGTQGDFGPGDNVYGWQFFLPGNTFTEFTRILLEIKAIDNQGNESTIWPYFKVY